MKTILISLFGFITALFFSYKKGASNQKQKQEQANDKERIRILETTQKDRGYVDSLSDDDVDKQLSDFYNDKSK
jgi:predicted histidine transporter YuiF (NhaC family)